MPILLLLFHQGTLHWHIVGIDLKYSRLRNRRGTGNKRRNWKIWKKKIIIGPWKFDKKIKVFEKKQKNRKIKQLTVEVVCIKNIGAELTHCTMGRGGVKTKWRQDACYWLWKLWKRDCTFRIYFLPIMPKNQNRAWWN